MSVASFSATIRILSGVNAAIALPVSTAPIMMCPRMVNCQLQKKYLSFCPEYAGLSTKNTQSV